MAVQGLQVVQIRTGQAASGANTHTSVVIVSVGGVEATP